MLIKTTNVFYLFVIILLIQIKGYAQMPQVLQAVNGKPHLMLLQEHSHGS